MFTCDYIVPENAITYGCLYIHMWLPCPRQWMQMHPLFQTMQSHMDAFTSICDYIVPDNAITYGCIYIHLWANHSVKTTLDNSVKTCQTWTKMVTDVPRSPPSPYTSPVFFCGTLLPPWVCRQRVKLVKVEWGGMEVAPQNHIFNVPTGFMRHLQHIFLENCFIVDPKNLPTRSVVIHFCFEK